VGGPDGGDGGGGGNVVFLVDSSVKSICSLLSHYRAKDGADGQRSYRQGGSGRDVIIKVIGKGFPQAQVCGDPLPSFLLQLHGVR
jgi:GTPase involved in cell partitioning and DNA repair